MSRCGTAQVGRSLGGWSWLALALGCAPVQGETVQAPPEVRQVVLTVDTGSVSLTAGPAQSNVQIVRRARAFPSTRGFHEKLGAGGVMTIDARCGGAPGCRVDYALRVPSQVAVVVEVRDGDVELAEVEGEVQVDVGLGKVRGVGLRSPKIDVRTEGGSIDLRFATTPRSVIANAAAGDVTLRVPAGAYRCDFAPAAGEPEVRCDPKASATIAASTGVGKLQIRATRR